MAMPGAATHSTSGDQDRCERLVGAVTGRGSVVWVTLGGALVGLPTDQKS